MRHFWAWTLWSAASVVHRIWTRNRPTITAWVDGQTNAEDAAFLKGYFDGSARAVAILFGVKDN